MKKKIRVGILFGGKSAEHEVSLQSAKNVLEALDKKRFEPVLIGIDKEGKWHLNDAKHFLLNSDNPKLIKLNKSSKSLALTPGAQHKQLIAADTGQSFEAIDVVFPVLHGPYGEDGSMQGLLKQMGIAYVGADVLGSAVGMDKDVMKRLLRDAQIPIGKFETVYDYQKDTVNFDTIQKKLGLPLFIKPANLGSSVGISMAKDKEQFDKGIAEAFQYDRKVVIEEYIKGREIECAVLGNDHPVASVPGEVVSNKAHHDFYSYEAKYIDEQGAAVDIPAKLPPSVLKQVQEYAVKVFQVLCCQGMARVDCFVTQDHRIIVNEINTLPGFTNISMYPMLWRAEGKSYTQLVSQLIDGAIERFAKERHLRTSVIPSQS